MTVSDSQVRYARIVKVLTKDDGVTVGAEKKGFGSSALQVNGKIFAMLSSKGQFVVKLPRDRAAVTGVVSNVFESSHWGYRFFGASVRLTKRQVCNGSRRHLYSASSANKECSMTVSVRQLTGAVVVSFCVGAFMSPVWTQVQGTAKPAQPPPAAAGQATYMAVEFMKVPDGKEQGWLKLERESWKPMHELRVKDGLIQSWATIAQTMPGDESNGPVFATVTTFRGWPDPTKTDWLGLLKKANPQADANALMLETGAARKIVRTEIWQVLAQTDPPVMGNK